MVESLDSSSFSSVKYGDVYDSFQLLGMAEMGMLPDFFATRTPYGTPLIGIIFSASGVQKISSTVWDVMEFAAFVKTRIEHPATLRPFKIPLGSVLMCIPPPF
ncbi:hypothetical protein Leryth_000560 [Lithospermum erythrorhizon]|nr:hypothetical protein Leryth_000560 [Lithospermum erythrorhizon]